MPELAKLEAEALENFGLVGILTDGQNKESAARIVDQVGLKMPNILLNEELYSSIQKVQYIPYIYFVDSEGRAINVELTGKQDLAELKEAIQTAFKSIE